jgi:hypothetical protein
MPFRPYRMLFALFVAVSGSGVLPAALVTDRSIGEARIVGIEATSAADLVVLDAGFEAGLRQSMVCQVSRSGESLGKLLLVDLRSNSSTALILNLNAGRSLQRGDVVTVQTVSSRNN